MSDFFTTNLDLDDWDVLLAKDELAEHPVPIEVFVEDQKFLGLPPLSEIQTEILKYSTQVLRPDTLVKFMGEEAGLQHHKQYTVNEVVCQLGKGSGKDHVSRIAQSYIVYLMHCLRDPLDYYGKSSGVSIDLVNLAVNSKQAQQVFFDPLKNILMASPWANEVGFEPRVQEIFWFERPVRMFSGHSESEGWEGYEVISVVLDEIAAFKTDSEIKDNQRAKGSASQIYDMARASVVSRFPTVGKVVLLSFPRFKGDFIQQRYQAILDEHDKEEDPMPVPIGTIGRKTWAIKASTWEVNPARSKEDFEDEFRRHPISSRARFMCEPPEMEDSYFKDADSVRRAFNNHDDPTGDDGFFKPWFNGTDGKSRFIHIDLGLKRDRTGLAMVHSPGLKEVKTFMGIEKLPVVNVDYVTSWEAAPGEEINYASVRAMIVDLCRRFEVASVTFDMWQSSDMIQSLRSMGINADWHTVKKADYDTLSTTIYDGRLRGYWNELLVEEELLKLKLLTNNKVDHGSTGSKDLADAVAGASMVCIQNFVSDAEIEIEVLDDSMIPESMDEFEDKVLNNNKQYKEPREIPEDLLEWLEIV